MFIAFVLASLSIADAKVDFSHSTMYDIYDFEGVDEIPIPRCDAGCLIFASTAAYKDSEDGIDPYMKNLLIYDPAKDRNQSLAFLAAQVDDTTSQKVPLDISPAGNYVILNLNEPEDKGSDVTVWIIERARAHEFDYEIYDVATMDRAASVSNTIVTIMSASQFRVIADPGEANSYTARLVGFDNALDNNQDMCIHAYKTPVNSEFKGFSFQVNAPIISIVFKERKHVNLTTDFNYVNVRDLAKSGFISSPGYNGCEKLGGDQVHRSKQYRYTEDYDMHGEPDHFRMFFGWDSELADYNQVLIKDMTNNNQIPMRGWQSNTIAIIDSTQLVIVSYDNINITAGESFMLRFTSTQLTNETAAPDTTDETDPNTSPIASFTSPLTSPTTSNSNLITSPSSTPTASFTYPSTSPTTSTVITPTTSSAGRVTSVFVAALVYYVMLR